MAYAKILTITSIFLLIFSANAEMKGYDKETAKKCFSNNPDSYVYHTFSRTPIAETEVILTASYVTNTPVTGDNKYTFAIEIDKDKWVNIATTGTASSSWDTRTYTIDKNLFNQALKNMKWIRIRNNNVYAGATGNCTKMKIRYNFEDLFNCPVGMHNFGIGCVPEHGYFSQLAGGRCNATNWKKINFEGIPEPTGDGKLSFEYNTCGGGKVTAQIFTHHMGWVEIDTDEITESCVYKTVNFIVPEAFIAMAINDDNSAQFRIQIENHGLVGLGCGTPTEPEESECFNFLELGLPY